MKTSEMISFEEAEKKGVKITRGWEINQEKGGLSIVNSSVNARYDMVVISGEGFAYDTLVKTEHTAPAVVPYYQEGNKVYVGLIKHWRPVLKSWSWEIIRGFGDSGVSDEENAVRELSEEWGSQGKLTKIGTFTANTGWDQSGYVAWAAQLDPKEKENPQPEISEQIEAREWFEFPKALPEIICGITLSCLLKFSQQAEKLS
ncbi:MAG: NUDIX domain-containing protein [bacterium]|nr:NUDIX domain-containing protein [bacterium]